MSAPLAPVTPPSPLSSAAATAPGLRPDERAEERLDESLPTRVLRLGPAWTAKGGSECTMHWICASAHHDECHDLVRLVHGHRAQVLLLHATDAVMLTRWLDLLQQARREGLQLPVVAMGMSPAAAVLRRAMSLGVEVWLDTPAPPDQLHRHLRWALWRAQAEAERAAALQQQLDDRKWTERAKGLLMTARDVDEDAAFRLLRETAMHAHLRLGEVARSVVHAAQRAEAVNLAGQQRMLSQRLVKLMAQRAAGIEAKRAKALQDESCDRVAANLARLPLLLPSEVDPVPLVKAWDRLQACLQGKPDAALLMEADAAAQALLTLSDRLATDIAAGGSGQPLQIVNLCGRQRMLSQRLAKEALLADLLPQRDASELADCLDRFAAGLVELEASPLSSEAIRALLAEVGAEWLRLMRCLRDTRGKEAATGLARSSEVLLQQLDMLTVHYQRSLQIILG